MPVIRFSPQAQALQVEDFPKDCERSCKGALHVRPNTTAIVTKGELAHLQKLKTPLYVVPVDDPAPKEPQKAVQATPALGAADTPTATSGAPGGASGGDFEAESSAGGSKSGGKKK